MTLEEQAEDNRRAEEQRRRCLAALAIFLDELADCVRNVHDAIDVRDPWRVLSLPERARLMTIAQYVLTYEVLPAARVHSLLREFGWFAASVSDESNFELIYDELKEIAT